MNSQPPIAYAPTPKNEKPAPTPELLEFGKLHLADCLDALRQMPDDFVDLAICDPPYGLPKSAKSGGGKLKARKLNQESKNMDWDVPPPQEYFEQLFRVSRNQIIWGSNYFNLPPHRCFVAWDKVQPWPNFSAAELAWTSFNKPAKLFKHNNRTGNKIHPTQKPTALYRDLLKTFANPGDRILDTHVGSASSLIAAWEMGFEFIGYEINAEYHAAATTRMKMAMNQPKLLDTTIKEESSQEQALFDFGAETQEECTA
jgi:site-specific DNA-methyltransferase (adenine-specific)